jgi:hypothetical protein
VSKIDTAQRTKDLDLSRHPYLAAAARAGSAVIHIPMCAKTNQITERCVVENHRVVTSLQRTRSQRASGNDTHAIEIQTLHSCVVGAACIFRVTEIVKHAGSADRNQGRGMKRIAFIAEVVLYAVVCPCCRVNRPLPVARRPPDRPREDLTSEIQISAGGQTQR